MFRPKFGVFSIIRYNSLHSIHLSRIRDLFITLVISTKEGHICRPLFWSRFFIYFGSTFGPLLRVFLATSMREWTGGSSGFFCKQPESDTLPWGYSKTVVEEWGCCWRKTAWGARYERALEGQQLGKRIAKTRH